MLPILYSFRRCPYAIRARLAIASAQQQVALREVVLRDKPEAFLNVSPSATVPCLTTTDHVIDESLDIMVWALTQSDPEALLQIPEDGLLMIERFDGAFKKALDHTKYAIRFPELDAEDARAEAMHILAQLEPRLAQNPWLFGTRPRLTDLAILPFVRQFAMIDKPRFDREALPATGHWLDRFLSSERFTRVMEKHIPWSPNAKEVVFPAVNPA